MIKARNTLVLALISGALACGVEAPQTADSTESISGLQENNHGIDVPSVIRRVQLSYRDEGGVFTAGRPAYAVRAEEGRVSFTPRHWQDPVERQDDIRREIPLLTGQAATIETIGLVRGNRALYLEAPQTSVDLDGSLRIERGAVREQFKNHDQGIEQLWHFSAEPRGEGDLEIRVQIEGQAYVGQDETGHHFIDEGNSVGLNYGVATWIDAAGREANVPVTFVDGELVLTVSDKLLRASAFPAVLDPVITAEFSLGATGFGPSNYPQRKPAIASNGTNYLIVWEDIRSGSSYDIYGARMTAGRVLLDAAGIVISEEPGHQQSPDIAFNGTNYLVVFQDERSTTSWDIYGTRVNGTGVPLDGNGFAIATDAGDQTEPCVSNAGSRWGVGWVSAQTGTLNTYYNAINANGTLVSTSRPGEPGGTVAHRDPEIACSGSSCLVVYTRGVLGDGTNGDIWGTRFVPATTQFQGAQLLSGDGRIEDSPDVAYDGTNFMVVFSRQAAGSNFDIYATRVSAAGAVLDTPPLVINERDNLQRNPAITYALNSYYVVWQDLRFDGGNLWDLMGTVTSTAGIPTNTYGNTVNLVGNSHQYFHAVAARNSEFFVAWQDTRNAGDDIYGTSVARTGAVQNATGVLVSRAASRQTAPTMDWNGTWYFVIFQDTRQAGTSNVDLVGVRVRPTGAISDPNGIPLVINASRQGAPDIAYDPDDNQWLLVFADDQNGIDNIRGARIAANFQVANNFAISTNAGVRMRFPRVSYNTSVNQFLVAWQDRSGAGATYDIRSTRVTPADAVLDAGGNLVNGAALDQQRVDVATDGTNWFAVWTDERNGADTEDLRGARINGATGVVDVADVAIAAVANRQTSPRIEFDGTNFITVWADERAGPDTFDIYGGRISPAGVALDATGIALASDIGFSETRPDVAIVNDTLVGGNTWFVAYRRQVAPNDEFVDLQGRQFTTAGVPVAARFLISGETGNEDQPAVSSGPANNAIVAYQRYVDDPTLRSERIFVRLLTFP